MLTALLMLASAQAEDETPIISGELRGTGHTLRAEDNQIYLNTYYARGVTPALEVGTSVLGWFNGANVSAEYAVIQNKEQALSGTLGLSYDWNGGYSASFRPIYTLGGQKTNRLNASLGYGRYKTVFNNEDGSQTVYSGATIPLNLSYDIVPKPYVTYRVAAASDIQNIIDGSPIFSVSGTWYRGWKTFRLGLGLTVTNYGVKELGKLLDTVGVDWRPPPLIPFPNLALWWRF